MKEDKEIPKHLVAVAGTDKEQLMGLLFKGCDQKHYSKQGWSEKKMSFTPE